MAEFLQYTKQTETRALIHIRIRSPSVINPAKLFLCLIKDPPPIQAPDFSNVLARLAG